MRQAGFEVDFVAMTVTMWATSRQAVERYEKGVIQYAVGAGGSAERLEFNVSGGQCIVILSLSGLSVGPVCRITASAFPLIDEWV